MSGSWLLRITVAGGAGLAMRAMMISVVLLCACSCALAVVVQRVFVCAACAVVRWLLEGNRSNGAAARSAGGGQAERAGAHTEDWLIINGGRPASGVAAVAAGAGCLRHAAAVVRQGSSLPNWVRRLGTKLFHSLWLLSATKLSLTKPTHAHATARASLSLSLCLPSAHFPSEKILLTEKKIKNSQKTRGEATSCRRDLSTSTAQSPSPLPHRKAPLRQISSPGASPCFPSDSLSQPTGDTRRSSIPIPRFFAGEPPRSKSHLCACRPRK